MTAPLPPAPARRQTGRRFSVPAVVAIVAGLLVVASAGRSAYEQLERDPARDGDTRILFVGDSLMMGASGQFERAFEPAGAETRFVGGYGTGLLSGQGWWRREIEAQVDTWRPDVVVIEACCNYGLGEPRFHMPDGAEVVPDTQDMYDWWAKEAEAVVDAAGEAGASVYWVTTPAASDRLWPLYTERIPRFNAIIDELEVARIDWRRALTPDGIYTATAVVDGTKVQVRDADGLHLVDAGNDLIVRLTYDAVNEDLGLA